MNTPTKTRLTRSRLQLLLVLSCFFAPLVVAITGYYGFEAPLAPVKQTNNAVLISPVSVLRDFSQPDIDGQRLDLDSLRRRWTIVHRLGGQCAQRCRTALYNTRQARLALGKDAHRVQRLILSPNATLLTELAAEQPDSKRALLLDNGLGQQLESIFRQHGMTADDAVLVDPLGNVMLSIPQHLNPSLLIKDLKKLLKVSRIG